MYNRLRGYIYKKGGMILVGILLLISLEGHQVFVYKYAGGFPEHGLYYLVWRDSSSPGESGTYFSYVVCLGQDSWLWSIDGGDEELWNSASIHLFVRLGVSEDGVDSPCVGEGQPTAQGVHWAQSIRGWILVQQCFDDNVGGWAVQSLVLIEEAWSDRDDSLLRPRQNFRAHSGEGCDLRNPVSCREGYKEQGFHEKAVWGGPMVQKFRLLQHRKDLVRVPCWD